MHPCWRNMFYATKIWNSTHKVLLTHSSREENSWDLLLTLEWMEFFILFSLRWKWMQFLEWWSTDNYHGAYTSGRCSWREKPAHHNPCKRLLIHQSIMTHQASCRRMFTVPLAIAHGYHRLSSLHAERHDSRQTPCAFRRTVYLHMPLCFFFFSTAPPL
jgi:hypothetical protein